jgi:hypothetical protein
MKNTDTESTHLPQEDSVDGNRGQPPYDRPERREQERRQNTDRREMIR